MLPSAKESDRQKRCPVCLLVLHTPFKRLYFFADPRIMETFLLKDDYYIYITTNKTKTLLSTGVAGSLSVQLTQWNAQIQQAIFPSKDPCIYLLYWERFSDMHLAIKREKEIKRWTQKKKITWINQRNPEWRFLNESFPDQFSRS